MVPSDIHFHARITSVAIMMICFFGWGGGEALLTGKAAIHASNEWKQCYEVWCGPSADQGIPFSGTCKHTMHGEAIILVPARPAIMASACAGHDHPCGMQHAGVARLQYRTHAGPLHH